MVKIKAFYIQEADKQSKIKNLFSHIKLDRDNIIIPVNSSEKRIKKLIRKIKKVCNKNNVSNIVVSKNLQGNEAFKNEIDKSELNIFDGRWLFGCMYEEVLDYILEKKQAKKEQTEISVLINNINNQTIQILKKLAKDYKRLNIVTNHINKLKFLEKQLYNEYGIMITLTNNRRKSLAKAELILNFDFVEEVLNKYNICENAIIINIEDEIKIHKKRFNGITVNNYEIKSKKAEELFEMERLKRFYLRDLVEAELYRKDSLKNIRKDITKNLFKIKNLYGNNGVLWN